MGETRFEKRLRSELVRDADRVTTSPDAWTRVQHRAAGTRPRAGRLVVATAGVAALAAVVAVTVLGRPATITIGPDPAGRTPVPTDAATTAHRTDQPTGTTSVPDLDWSSVPLEGSVSASLEGIANVGDTVLVVGEDRGGGAVTWISRDAGESFAAQPTQADVSWMDATAVDGRIVVVGSADGRPAIDVFDPASETWDVAYRGDDPGTLYGVTDGPGGPIATGNVHAGGGRHGLIVGLGIDGWAPVDAPAMGGRETVLYHGVGQARGYVTTGYGPDERSIIDSWFSPDGRQWTHLNATPQEGIHATDGVIDALVADPESGSFWAVQAGGDVWTSDDGRRWSVSTSLTDDDGHLNFRSPAATSFAAGLLVVAGTDSFGAYWFADDADDAGDVEEIGRVDAQSLAVGAGITLAGDAVLVPLSRSDGSFVWRGVPTR